VLRGASVTCFSARITPIRPSPAFPRHDRRDRVSRLVDEMQHETIDALV